jgi:hypothetical protein
MEYLERVSVIEGKKPIIYVAPHGVEDINTGIMASVLAESTNGYAVINNGWRRGKEVNYKNEIANCNNAEHCHKDVVKEEFLDPIIRFKNRILKKWSRAMIVYLHGMGDKIRERTQIPDLNYIVGFGRGNPNSFTCQKWIKDFVIYHIATGDNCKVGEGKSGGSYAGWKKNNMVQLFRQWYDDEDVDALQLEMIYDLRKTKRDAKVTAQIIAIAMSELLECDGWDLPDDFTIPKV